jgi:hypothetical protein
MEDEAVTSGPNFHYLFFEGDFVDANIPFVCDQCKKPIAGVIPVDYSQPVKEEPHV